MAFFEWENGEEVQGEYDEVGYAEINNQQYPVYMPTITGETPITAENLNRMEGLIEEEIDARTIVESGSNANGKYVKYGDGTMIVSQRYSATISGWTAWGSMYSSQIATPPNFPVAFIETPTVVQSVETNGVNFWVATRSEGQAAASSTRANTLQAVRPTSYSGSATVYVNIIAIGRWK